MICKNCGQEIPNDSVFCTHCGTACEQKPAEAANEQNEQQTVSDQTYVQQPAEAVPPKKKGKGPKIKLIAILAAIIIVVAGVGTLAYNSQPVLSRLFNGEKEHLTMLVDRLEEKYTQNENAPVNNVKAKMNYNFSYDLKQLEEAGLPLDGIENTEIFLSQTIRIDSDKALYRIDQEGSLLGAELPEMSVVRNSSEDMGIYIESLTKDYIDYSSFLTLLNEYGVLTQAELSANQPATTNLSAEQLEELLPLLEKYKDAIIDTALDSGEVVYESNNDDLGFNAYYYEITLTPESIYDIMQAIMETLNTDDQLKLELCELISPDNPQEMLEELNTSISELLDGMAQDRDSFVQEMETELDEIKIELWFDGRNNPLGTALAINASEDSTNQDIEITLLDYKHGRDTLTLIGLDIDGETMFELINEAKVNGSRKQGSLDLEINQIKLLKGEYDLTGYEVQGIQLYEGTADFTLTVETDSSMTADFSLECTMDRMNNGMRMDIEPTVYISGYNMATTMDFGAISSEITVEPLDEEIEEVNVVEVTDENYADVLTPDEFLAKVEEFASTLENLVGDTLPSTDSPLY